MHARRTKKENEPHPVKSEKQGFAWQYFEVVDAKTAIEAVALFLYPDEASPGGYPDKNATERVRIAVRRARKKKLILPRASNRPNTLFVYELHFTGIYSLAVVTNSNPKARRDLSAVRAQAHAWKHNSARGFRVEATKRIRGSCYRASKATRSMAR